MDGGRRCDHSQMNLLLLFLFEVKSGVRYCSVFTCHMVNGYRWSAMSHCILVTVTIHYRRTLQVIRYQFLRNIHGKKNFSRNGKTQCSFNKNLVGIDPTRGVTYQIDDYRLKKSGFNNRIRNNSLKTSIVQLISNFFFF